jgi:RecA-family ATPase
MNNNYFLVRPIAQVIEEGRLEKSRRKIIGAFVYEDTVSYFYAPPNYGKSMCVFQFAYAAATGTSLADCEALKNECEPKVVLAVDLEMDAQTIYERHEAVLNAADPRLLENLIYLHEPVSEKPLFNYDLLLKILDIAVEKKAELIIIDNISKLLPDLLKAEEVTRFIEFLNRMRIQTGAAIVIIAHTIKFNPSVAVQINSFYGSSMIGNFFKEMFYLDQTRDGKYFLCHAKTKHREVYNVTVPVFTLGDHPAVGTGFTFEALMNLSDVQMPLTMVPEKSTSRKYSLSDYRRELIMMEQAGIKRNTIAEICNVGKSTITKILSGP